MIFFSSKVYKFDEINNYLSLVCEKNWEKTPPKITNDPSFHECNRPRGGGGGGNCMSLTIAKIKLNVEKQDYPHLKIDERY